MRDWESCPSPGLAPKRHQSSPNSPTRYKVLHDSTCSCLPIAGALDHQCITFKMAGGVAVIPRKGNQFFLVGQRFVHLNRPNLVVEFVNDRDHSRRALDDFEWIGRG